METLKSRTADYRSVTKQALEKIRVFEGLTKRERKIADDFLDMAKRYYADADHFEKTGARLLALPAYSYAHAWLDAGVRAGLLDAQGDDRLFTLPRIKSKN